MKNQLIRCAGFSATALLAGVSVPSLAQTVAIPTMPLTDVQCAAWGSEDCVAPSGRTTTVITETVTPNRWISDVSTVSGQYQVNYSGELSLGGYSYGEGFLNDWYQTNFSADVTTQYTGTLVDRETYNSHIQNSSFPFFDSYSNFSTTLNSLSVDMQNVTRSDANENYYQFSLATPDPTAVNGLSTQVTGTLQRTGGILQFSRLNGTATLVENPGEVPLMSSNGSDAGYSAYNSAFAVRYDVTETVLTQLDANGLITPKVTVTEGIEMNGSQITGLGDGVLATDAVNKGQLDAEAAARVAADAALATAITDEAATRAAADTVLATSIDTEAAARIAADTAIANSVTVEATARGSADVAANQRIDNFEAQRTALASSLATETNARLAADVDLTNRINAVDARIATLEARIDKLDDRLASSTATAIAIQGGAFLPGNRYNISMNMATYDGAHAGALSFAALVSPKVAVNVSAAHGFNKHGDTGVRAGLTFMW